MCCFSKPVRRVYDTSIFCRMGAKGNQVVIYSMTLDAKEDLAMILPVPMVTERSEDSVQFIDLSNYKKFFPMLDRGFSDGRSDPFGAPPAAAARSKPLAVEEVGSYAASFVPTVKDFERLDPQFRLDSVVWENLPQYAGHGFVVFKLRAGKKKIHPMAFAYPALDRKKIVFPTVHIHDGEVHQKAGFDHALYCQSDSGTVRMNWAESTAPLGRFINAPAAKGTVRGNEHVYKFSMVGEFPNEDVEVPSGA